MKVFGLVLALVVMWSFILAARAENSSYDGFKALAPLWEGVDEAIKPLAEQLQVNIPNVPDPETLPETIIGKGNELNDSGFINFLKDASARFANFLGTHSAEIAAGIANVIVWVIQKIVAGIQWILSFI